MLAALTRILAIWLYVAGHSLVLPMSRKNSERRLNTSASVVSRRLLYWVWSSRTSFKRVTADQKMEVNRCHKRSDHAIVQVKSMREVIVYATHLA